MFCDDLDGRHGGGGREVRKGGDICMHLADLLHSIAETNATLKSNYIPIKNKLKKRNRLRNDRDNGVNR